MHFPGDEFWELVFDSFNGQNHEGIQLSSIRIRSYQRSPPINHKLLYHHDLRFSQPERYWVRWSRFGVLSIGTYSNVSSLGDPATIILETAYDKYGADRPIQYLWACRYAEEVLEDEDSGRRLLSDGDPITKVVASDIEYEFELLTPTVAPTMDVCWSEVARPCCNASTPINIQWLDTAEYPPTMVQGDRYFLFQLQRQHTAYLRLSFYENWNDDDEETRYFVEIAFLSDDTIEIRKRQQEYGDFDVIDSAPWNPDESIFWISWADLEWFAIGTGTEVDQQVLVHDAMFYIF